MANSKSIPDGFTSSIESAPSRWSLGLLELWQYRHMIYYLVLRDFTSKYKQTVLGPFWVILSPFITMILFTFLFGTIANIPSYDVPYPVFSYTGLIPWTLFSTTLQNATISIVKNSNMITKVAFPRLILPFVEVGVSFANFLISLLSLFILMAIFGYLPTANIIWSPIFILLALITSTGVSLWLAPINVWSRDVQRGLTFLTTAWMYFSPVAYPREEAPEIISNLMLLNPMTTVLEGFRWAFIGIDTPPDQSLIMSSLIALTIFLTGVLFFKRMERRFADVI